MNLQMNPNRNVWLLYSVKVITILCYEETYLKIIIINKYFLDVCFRLGFELVPPHGILGLFESFLGMGKSRKNRTAWLLIWHTIVWTIWNSRNDVLFLEWTFSVECLVDTMKLLSWKWFLGKNPGTPYSFYEWGIHPTFCCNRYSLIGCGFESCWI
jgi:hypothetical protein